MVKFGKIKRQHGRVEGLDPILDEIVRRSGLVSRVVPGRIYSNRRVGPRAFRIQYPTGSGLKCIYSTPGSVQEVFLICRQPAELESWLIAEGFVSPPESKPGVKST